jgi:hypothetical protein
VKKYKGTADFGYFKVEESYKTIVIPRIGIGFEYVPLRTLPIAVALEASLDISNAKRDNIKLTYEDNKVYNLVPTGQLNLPDNSFFCKLTFGYLIDL